MYAQRAFPRGETKATALQEARIWKQQYYATHITARTDAATFVGPTNAGGRIIDIEIPQSQPNTYYIGAATGGVFRTEDRGATWEPIYDDGGVLSIGDIELSTSDSDLVWLSTGEADAVSAYPGDGVYKSEDGGDSWLHMGLPDIGTVGKVRLDPNDNEVIYVAAMGPLYRESRNKGVYKSENGGKDWSQILYIDSLTGAIDLAMHPSNSEIIYASMWEREFSIESARYGGPNSGLYRTNDGGDNWEKLTEGLPETDDISKIKVDVALSNPHTVYALYINARGNIEGFYHSKDRGDTWTKRSTEELPSVGFNEYFGDIYIDPTDENTVYNMGFETYRTINAGQSWEPVFTDVHFDQQSFAFSPTQAGHLVIGNDGGLYSSTDGGATSTHINNLPITQVYRLHVNEFHENTIYAGAQDNGSWRSVVPGETGDWQKINQGDGMQPLASSVDGSVFFTSTQLGEFFKQGDAIGFQEASPILGNDERVNWNTPVTYDANNPDILYYGSNKVHRSTDAAESWNLISPDLSDGPGSGNRPFGTITTIDVSILDGDVIYAGLDDGNIWVTENGGTDWSHISADLPVRYVTKVYASRDDVNTVYATLSGYRYGEDNGNIYSSSDKGKTWEALGASLPDIPINDVVTDSDGKLIIATDAGLFLSENEGVVWQPICPEIPSLIITDLYMAHDDHTLYAATYGRSIYKVELSSVISSTDLLESQESAFVLAPNPARDYISLTLPAQADDITITIYNGIGTAVMKLMKSDLQEMSVDVSQLRSGTYYVHLKADHTYAIQELLIL